MGVSFHSAGCIKVAKECSTESSAININSSQRRRATKIQEKPAGGVTPCPRKYRGAYFPCSYSPN